MSHYTGCVISGQNWSTVFKKPEICFNTCSKASPLTADDVRSSVVAKKFAILCNSAQQTKSLTPAATAPQVGTLASLGGGERRSETVANLAAERLPDGRTTCIALRRESERRGERRGRHK